MRGAPHCGARACARRCLRTHWDPVAAPRGVRAGGVLHRAATCLQRRALRVWRVSAVANLGSGHEEDARPRAKARRPGAVGQPFSQSCIVPGSFSSAVRALAAAVLRRRRRPQSHAAATSLLPVRRGLLGRTARSGAAMRSQTCIVLGSKSLAARKAMSKEPLGCGLHRAAPQAVLKECDRLDGCRLKLGQGVLVLWAGRWHPPRGRGRCLVGGQVSGCKT